MLGKGPLELEAMIHHVWKSQMKYLADPVVTYQLGPFHVSSPHI